MLKAFGQPSNLSENDHQLQEGLPLYLSLFVGKGFISGILIVVKAVIPLEVVGLQRFL